MPSHQSPTTKPKRRPEVRTPQACDRCRQSKTKCDGDRPQCRGCLKRRLRCSWPKHPNSGTHYFLNSLDVNSNAIARSDIPSIVQKNKNVHAFPEAHLLHRLLAIFFARHHDVELCSFLHKPSVDIVKLIIQSPFLVSSIISLATLYISQHDASKEFGFESVAALSDHYARLARTCAQTLHDEPSVYTTQAYLVLAVRELITWSNFKAWMYAGTAIRMAQALRLGTEFNQRYSPRQKEVRRRTFWACFVVDRLISYSCNHPFSIDMLSVRIQLPCPENTFSLEDAYSGPSLHNISLHGNQLSRLGITPFYIKMLCLWGDMGLLHISGGRRRINHPPTDPSGEFYQNEKAIENFSSSLPQNLQWSTQNYHLHQIMGQAQSYVNLNFMLFHSRCVMHQEYLPQLDLQYSLSIEVDESVSYDAAGLSLDHISPRIIDTCVSNVHAMTEMATILNNGSEQDRQMLHSTVVANALMTAAAVHLWILYTQTCEKCPKDVARANFDKLLQIFKSWQPQWRVAFAWTETLEMLYKLYEFSYSTEIVLDWSYWEIETGETASTLELDEEPTDVDGRRSGLSTGDGIQEPTTVCKRLHDKVRNILSNPLHATDVKKQNLRVFCQTLWQDMWHMWSNTSPGGIGDDFTVLGDVVDPINLSGLSNDGTFDLS